MAIWETGTIRDAVVINGFTDTGIKCQIYPESNPDYVLSIEAKLMNLRYMFVPVLLLTFLPSIYAAGQKRHRRCKRAGGHKHHAAPHARKRQLCTQR